MSESILFCNTNRTILVIDIPTSIASSQDGGVILSSAPISKPFQTAEPKGQKREGYLSQFPAQHIAHQNDVQIGIAAAHKECQTNQWYLSRALNESVSHESVSSELNSASIVLSTVGNNFKALTDIQGVLVFNENNKTVHVDFGTGQRMHVPAQSVFLWSSIERGVEIVQETYELVLMDPPWMNRSVRRSSSYLTAENQSQNPFPQALEIVDVVCVEKGYAAVWVTNKAAIRDEVLTGMTGKGFQLIEEWIWCKLTSRGEFVSPLDGVWRKPYEVMLLFRRNGTGDVTRRYIFGVPDLHSRKPSLKWMFQEILGVKKALELFARHVTAGWCSIGNEVTMMQFCDQWKSCPD